MFTRCPACHTLFRIAPKQLKAARGQVRCGSCQAVFDGVEFLVNREELSKEELAALTRSNEITSGQWQLPFDDTSPSAQDSTMPAEMADEVAASPQPAVSQCEHFSESTARPAAVSAEVETAEASSMPEGSPEEDETLETASAADEPPTELESPIADSPAPALKWSPRYSLSGHEPDQFPARKTHRFGWALASLLMIAVLAAQLTWFNRDTLTGDPRWRPWLEIVCDKAGCVLPPLRDPHAIEMVDRNVQSHPHYQGALLITATLVNQATFAQPYPQVELSMTDLDQKRVAVRRFKPVEYLENSHAEGLIPPGASVHLKLEIDDPGQEAVGFEFEFF